MLKLFKNAESNALLVVFITVFVDMLGVGILLPVIPQLLGNPQSPFYLLPNGYTLQTGFIILGFLTASFPLAQFLATPILGQLSDKYGRKKILAISLFGTSLSYAMFAIGILTRNITLLFISRIIDGITGGNIAVAQAAIADVSPPDHRAKNFGLIGAAFGLGFILGPYIGGKLSDPTVVSWFNAATPFWFASILSLLNVISVLYIFPETLKNLQHHVVIHWNKSIKNIIHAATLEKLRTLFLTNFLFNSGFAFFTTFFSIYLINKFHFTAGSIGDFFAYVGLWIAITQAVITRFTSRKFKEYNILKVTVAGTGVCILLYLLPNVWWQLLFIAPFMAICNGLSFANIAALISKSAGNTIQGEVLGINSSVQALGQAIPPILAGYIAASLTPEAPIVVSSAIIILAGIVFITLYKHQQAQKTSPQPIPAH